MITPLEIARIGIRYFVKILGWSAVARIVREERPKEPPIHHHVSDNFPNKKSDP